MSQGLHYRFPTTQWTAIERAGGQGTAGLVALDQLLVRYLGPLRAHLTMYKRLAREDAEDLLQGFISEKVLERQILEKADPQRGRFRTFLLVALDRYVASELRTRGRKRRSASGQLPVDQASHALDPKPGPSDAFEIAWARQVLADAARRMHDQCLAGNRQDLWEIFEGRVLAPTLDGSEPIAYEQFVRQFSISSTQAVNLLTTAKRMYARNLRGVVGEYMTDDQQIDQEIAELRAILGRPRD